MRRIWGLARQAVTGGWRKPHNEINDRHSLTNITLIRQTRYVAETGRADKCTLYFGVKQ
jgi:hypothetical protein